MMSCIGGVHVFRMAYLTICCVLLKHMCGGHVLLEGMYIGGHVLLFEMSYLGTCFARGHILQNDLLYRGTPLI